MIIKIGTMGTDRPTPIVQFPFCLSSTPTFHTRVFVTKSCSVFCVTAKARPKSIKSTKTAGTSIFTLILFFLLKFLNRLFGLLLPFFSLYFTFRRTTDIGIPRVNVVIIVINAVRIQFYTHKFCIAACLAWV